MKRWAILTTLLYGLALLLLTPPIILAVAFDLRDPSPWTAAAETIGVVYRHWGFWLWLTVMLTAEALLLLLPLHIAEGRPKARRPVTVMVVIAGFLMANLFFTGCFSVICAFIGDRVGDGFDWAATTQIQMVQGLPWLNTWFSSMGIPMTNELFALLNVLGMIAVLWGIWGIVFFGFSQNKSPEGLVPRLQRWLLRGSILEFLVAVPSHILVRRRGDCCAPGVTAWGIATGVSIMLMAFGPGVLFLFAKRIRQLQPPNKPKE